MRILNGIYGLIKDVKIKEAELEYISWIPTIPQIDRDIGDRCKTTTFDLTCSIKKAITDLKHMMNIYRSKNDKVKQISTTNDLKNVKNSMLNKERSVKMTLFFKIYC